MIRIIPAIDIIGGEAIRLQQGDFNRQSRIAESLPNLVTAVKNAGLKDLHLVNLSAAKEGRLRDLDLIAEIASSGLKVDYGGGIRSIEDVELLFDLGIAEVNVGSMILKGPQVFESILKKYPNRLIASLDVKNEKIAVNAWQEQSEISIYLLLEKYRALGLKKVCVTDIAKDGMMAGPSLDLYQSLLNAFPDLELVASGGVRNRQDVLALNDIGCESVVIGKAWLSGAIQLKDLC